jgi:adenylate kinase family enzyme
MRILITGASGAGSTTLGRTLAAVSNYDFFDADDFYWLQTDPPFQSKQDPAVRLRNLCDALKSAPKAVIAGSILNWGVELEDSLSLIVFLTVPTPIRIERLRERETRRFGRVNPTFLKWASQYDIGEMEGRSLQRHEKWLALRRCPVLRIDGDTSTEGRMAQVRARVSTLAEPARTADSD